jgi:nucleotide sugar dehydrogenase
MNSIKENQKQKIAIIGLGYVGLPLAILADKKGYDVIGVDKDSDKVGKINKKECFLADQEIASALKRSNLVATSNFADAKNSEIFIICVPTPVYQNYMPDLGPIKSACEAVAPYLKKGDLVILESTVNPGISEEVILPIIERISELKCGKDFYLAHCPERINPGDPKWNVENIPRVIGSYEKKGLKKAVDFYKSVLTGQIKEMNSLKEAEACKIVENSFRDVNIAFVNELAKSFNKLGIDVVNVIDGAATKPFAFLAHYPGCGVGGHCIAVDPYYLIEHAKKNGFFHEFLSTARRINNSMPIFAVDMLVDGLNEKEKAIKKTKVAVLGLAYKANVGDDRESPSYEIIKELTRRGAIVETYDPFIPAKSTLKSLDAALDFADAVVIATNHKVFKELNPEKLEEKGIYVVVDGRNCLDKKAFSGSKVLYRGIGR